MTQPPPSFHLSDFENLQEDLVLLQTSMAQRRVDPSRAKSQCSEILGAVAEITQEQQLGEYSGFVSDLVAFVDGASAVSSTFGETFWALTLDVLDELLAALEMADAGLKIDEDAMRRHIESFVGRLTVLRETAPVVEAPPADAATAEVMQFEIAAEDEASEQTALETATTLDTATTEAGPVAEQPAAGNGEVVDEQPHALLQRAAEAAAAGRDDEAQALASRATEMLSDQVRLRKQAQLQELRNQCHVLASEREAADGELAQAETERERLQGAATQAQQLRDEAEASFLELAGSMTKVKTELEELERRMEELQQTQRELMTRFEEGLPAKEAAERAFEYARSEADALETAMREEATRVADIRTSRADALARQERLQEQLAALEREIST